nr:hypothetical protein [Tanacetum cinerariifolium]
MSNKDCASWDLGKRTWGGREGCVGTVPVLAGNETPERVLFKPWCRVAKEERKSCFVRWINRIEPQKRYKCSIYRTTCKV